MVGAVDQLSGGQLLEVGETLLALNGQRTGFRQSRVGRNKEAQACHNQDDTDDGHNGEQVGPREGVVR